MNYIKYILLCFLITLLQYSNAQINAAFVAVPNDTGCAPFRVDFFNTSTGSPDNCSWNFGNNATSSICTPTFTFTQAGSYIVTLTVTKGNTTSTFKDTIIVYNKPIANFVASNIVGCEPLVTSFTDLSTTTDNNIVSWQWDFGDGNTSEQQNNIHTYNFDGYKNVFLKITDNRGCESTLQKVAYINVLDKPNANFTSPNHQNCVIPTNVIFQNTTSGGNGIASSNWTFGDNTSSNQLNPQHNYTNSGRYDVGLIVTGNNSCKDTIVKDEFVILESILADFSISPQKICKGNTIYFQDNSNNILANLSWNFGNGQTASNVKNASVVYENTGTYTVTLTATYNNCTHTISKQIVVEDNPTIDFTIDNKTVSCNSPSTLSANFPDNNYLYTWYIVDRAKNDTVVTEHGRTTSINFYEISVNSISYDVILEVTNSLGCTASLRKDNFVNVVITYVNIIYLEEPTCYWLPIRPTVIINSAHAFDSIIWNFGDGTPDVIGQVAPFHTYDSEGNYEIKVRVVYNNCEVITKSEIISVGYKVSNFIGSVINNTVCIKDSVLLKAANLSNLPLKFEWLTGDGDYETGKDTYHNYLFPSQDSKYPVKLISNYLGCTDTLLIDSVKVLSPKSVFFIETDCKKERTIKIVNASIGTDSIVYHFGDGTTFINPSNVFEYTYTDTTTDKFDIYQIVYNYSTNCIDSSKRGVSFPKSNISIKASKNDTCAPYKTTISSNLEPPFLYQLSNFYWVINNDTCKRCTEYNDYLVKPNNTYDVKLVLIYSDSCETTITKNNFLIGYALSASVQYKVLNSCIPASVLFIDSVASYFSDIDSISYNFGDGTFVDTLNPIHQYADTGLYTYSLFLRNTNGCAVFFEDTIRISSFYPDFTTNIDTTCTNIPIQFNSNIINDKFIYLWDFGDGNTASIPNPMHSYAQRGNYTVQLTVTDEFGCSKTITKNNKINIQDFIVDFVADQTLKACPTLKVNFQLTGNQTQSNLEQLYWSFGNNNYSNDLNINPSTIYTQGGKYTVELFVKNRYQCEATILKHDFIEVLGPSGKLNIKPNTICIGDTVTMLLQKTTSIKNHWDFGDGNAINNNSTALFDTIQYVYTTAGVYLPSVVIEEANGCQAIIISSDTVFVNQLQTNILASTLSLCDSGLINFSHQTNIVGNTQIQKIEWLVNNQLVTTNNTFQYLFKANQNTTTYSIKLAVTTNNGCISYDSIQIKVYASPKITLADEMKICKTELAKIKIEGANHYQWTPNLNFQNGFYTTQPIADTWYFVTAYNDNALCFTNDSIFINVIDTINATVSFNNSKLCIGDSIQLQAYADTTANNLPEFLWSPNSAINDISIANPIIYPNQNQNYLLTVSSGKCTPKQIPIQIEVVPIPTVQANSPYYAISGSTVQLDATSSNEVDFYWSPNQNVSCNPCASPLATVFNNTTFKVIAFDSNHCEASTTVDVLVYEECSDKVVFLPNTFTPDNNGQNDELKILGHSIDHINIFRVYDRWGKLLFETNNMSVGWNGTFNGEVLPSGVYVYYIEAYCINGLKIIKTGDVTLLR